MFPSFKTPLRLAVLLCCLAAASPGAKAAGIIPLDCADSPSQLTGICITEIPEDVRVMLGNRILRPGDVLTAEQAGQLSCVPVSAMTGGESQLRYLPIFSEGIAAEAVISLRGRQNQAPVAEDMSVETYKNLPSEGMLPVSDPEDEELVFTVVRQPRRGSVILRPDGSYLYTPEKNKVGTDSFTYTATDSAGNASREATVTVRILKPTDELQYSDTDGLDCRFEAEWLRQSGIFSGETVSGQLCFSPEEQVTRGQFLAMLMETLEMPVDHSVGSTGFLDDSPAWLRPYLAAALRSGLITGYPGTGGSEFRPDQSINGEEAAGMICNALQFALPTALTEDGAIAAWASEGTSAGLSLPEGEETMTRARTAELLYQVSRLKSGAPGLSALLG